jgi:2-oxoglutarate dehydrogenase E1 component
VIDDKYVDASKVKKVLLCSGKMYFDLQERQQKDKRNDVAIIRLEQIYPLPYKQLESIGIINISRPPGFGFRKSL